MSAPTMADDVLAVVRQAIEDAKAKGDAPPGRPTLVKLTGATDHQVKVALATLASAGDKRSPVGNEASPAVTNGHPVVKPFGTGEHLPRPGAANDGNAKPELLVTSGGDSAATGGGDDPAGTSSASAGDSRVTSEMRGGKFVAWCGFVFGSIVSVAANVLAARIPPHEAPEGWKPKLDAQLGAAVWPLALMLSVEVLSRIPWPDGKLWKLARYGGVGLVAAGSAVISYQHIRDVLASWGYPSLSAGVGPLVVDGLMIASGFALLAIGGGRLAKPGASKSPAGEKPAKGRGKSAKAGEKR